MDQPQHRLLFNGGVGPFWAVTGIRYAWWLDESLRLFVNPSVGEAPGQSVLQGMVGLGILASPTTDITLEAGWARRSSECNTCYAEPYTLTTLHIGAALAFLLGSQEQASE